MAAHLVNRRGYYSIEESYRDEQGRPRKRILRYLGKRASDPGARLQQILATAERKAEEYAEWQRETFGESAQERRDREEAERQFTPEKFLAENLSDTGSAVSAELNDGQPDSHKEGVGDNAEGEVGDNSLEGHKD